MNHFTHLFDRQRMMRIAQPGSLAVNATFVSIGAVMQRACVWGMIALFAKLGSPTVVGQFALALAIVLPINRFASLQLPQLVLADPAKRVTLARCLTVHALMHGTAILLLGACMYLLNVHVTRAQIVMLVAVAKAFESASEVCYAFFYRWNRARGAAVLQTIRGVTALVLVGATYFVSGNLLYAVACLAATYALFACCIDLPVTWRLTNVASDETNPGGVTLEGVRELVTSSVPLGVCSLLAVLYACLPRYALNATMGAEGLGIFEALVSLTLLADVVCQSVARASAAHFTQALVERNRSRLLGLYKRVGLFYGAIGGGGVLLSLLFGKSLLAFVYSDDYARYGGVLAALMVARTIAFISAYDTLLLTMNRYRTLVASWIIGGATLAWMIAVLVPSYGLIGIALAVAAGNGVRCVWIHGVILRFLGSDWSVVGRSDSAVPLPHLKRTAA